jgi:hypothetical protein
MSRSHGDNIKHGVLALSLLFCLFTFGLEANGVRAKASIAPEQGSAHPYSSDSEYCLLDSDYLKKIDQLELFLRASLEDILWHDFEIERFGNQVHKRSSTFRILYSKNDSKIAESDREENLIPPFHSRNLNALRQILSDRLVQVQRKACEKLGIEWKQVPMAEIRVETQATDFISE